MRLYANNVVDGDGKPLAVAQLTVKLNGSVATIYGSAAGTRTGNPITTTATGGIAFWVDTEGIYQFYSGNKLVFEDEILLPTDTGWTSVLDYGVQPGGNDNTAAFQRMLNDSAEVVMVVPPGNFYLSPGLTIPVGCQLVSMASGSATATGFSTFGASRLVFSGSGAYGFASQDPTVYLNEGAFKGLTITTTDDATLDWIMDVRGLISWMFFDLRMENRYANGGVLRSRAITPGDPTLGITWLNYLVGCQLRAQDGSTRNVIDIDWSDSEINGGAFTGGIGSIYRGPGNISIRALFDRSSDAGLTLSKELTSNGTISVVGSFLDANAGCGIRVKANASPGGLTYQPTIQGCGFRNYAAPYDVIFDSTGVASQISGPQMGGNSHSESGVAPISVDTTKWDVRMQPSAYTNTAFLSSVFGDTRSTMGLIGREGINLQGPIYARTSKTFRSAPNVAAAFGVDTDASAMALLGAKDGLSAFLFSSRLADGTATDLLLGTDNTSRVRLASDGSQLRPDADGTLASGAPTFNWNGGYSKFWSVKSGTVAPTLGTGQGAAIWHSSTDGYLKAKFAAITRAITPREYNAVADFGCVADGSTDNAAAAAAALAAVSAAGGGVLWFPGNGSAYCFASKVTNSYSNVLIRGDGSDISHDVGALGAGAATTFKWTGAAAGTMLEFSSPTGASAQKKSGGGVEGIYFKGNTAGIGLNVLSWNKGRFEDLFFEECSTAGINMNVVATLGEARDPQGNEFRRIGFRNFTTSGSAIILDGDATANTSMNVFEQLDAAYKDGDAFVLKNSDNNLFIRCRALRAGGGVGNSLVFHGSNSALAQVARANHFIKWSGPVAAVAKGTTTYTYASHDNTFDRADVENGTPYPTVETGATVWFTDNAGYWRAMAINSAGLGDSRTTAIAARNAISTETLRISNSSSNHIRMADGTNEWGLSIDSVTGNARFARVSGTGVFAFGGDATSGAGLTLYNATAIPAGGTAGSGLKFTTTSNFGVFFGSGAPTLSAAKGSLYLRSDGSSTSTRLYVNTDGSTTWTNVPTAA